MKNLFIIAVAGVGLSLAGCSSSFRTAQTPDDVYYSEGQANLKQERQSRDNFIDNSNDGYTSDGYTSYWESQDDNYLKMKVKDRGRWGGIDDFDYWQGYNNNFWVGYNTRWNSPWMNYNPFSMHPTGMYGWNNPYSVYNPFLMGGNSFNSGFGFNSLSFGWGSWYNNWTNPYCWSRPVTVINKYPSGSYGYAPPSRTVSALAPFQSNSYYRKNGSNANGSGINASSNFSRLFYTPADSRSSGGSNSSNTLFRSVERSRSSGSSSFFDRPVRTFENSSSNSSSSGNSSSGSRSSSSSSSSGSSSSGSSRGGRGG